ncbi:dihydroorotase [Lactobacillus terrae]|uniref:dihydroorotase n=1 Tax=Lactobacillus terrae TaxID=2269374 RepID=UPI000C1B6E40|nr:dihydroorotase [Lactobacillus terrae]
MTLSILNTKLFQNNKFIQTDFNVESEKSKVINFDNTAVLPGLVDMHVHFREPGQTHKETIKTGSMASAHGGFTTVAAMPNVTPVPDTVEKFKNQIELNHQNSQINTLQYAPITFDETSDELVDIEGLSRSGAFAFSNDGHGVMNAKTMLDAMNQIAQMDSHLCAHVEDKNLMNSGYISKSAGLRLGIPYIESCATSSQLARDLILAKESNVHYHVCHISTRQELNLIRIAKDAGINVTCEVAPHHIILNEEDIVKDDAQFKMNPPLRSKSDQQAMIEGIIDGTIDMIATDHAPHAISEKDKGFVNSAFGITGIETSFSLMYTHLVVNELITLEKLVQLMSVNPSRIFNIESDIYKNFTVIDLSTIYKISKKDFLSKGINTPFDGELVNGRVLKTYYKGEEVYSFD